MYATKQKENKPKRGALPIFLSLCYLFVGIIFNTLAQLYGDQVENYPKECQLRDFGTSLGGELFSPIIADVIFFVSFIIFFIFLIVYTRKPDRSLRRFFWLWGTGYFLRCLALLATRFPRKTNFMDDNYQPASLALGIVLIIVGAEETNTDYMFSGHTYGFLLMSAFLYYYMGKNVAGWMIIALNIFGVFSVWAGGLHYLVDIVIAAALTFYIFNWTFCFLDEKYKASWRSTLTFFFQYSDDKGIKLPIKLVDGDDKEVTRLPLPVDADKESNETYYFNPSKYTNPVKSWIYELLTWLF